MFHVGQKVVCVDASASWFGYVLPIKKGSIYTICNLVPDCWGEIGVELAELETPIHQGHLRAYHPRRFRAVVERKTDISIFKAMLSPRKVRVEA